MARKAKKATKFIVPVDETRAKETFGFGDNSNEVDKLINVGGTSTPDWYHLGADYDCFSGTQAEQYIFAVANGEVYEVGLDDGSGGGFGNYVILKHTLPSQETVYSFYAHMEDAPLVSKGDFVDIGDTLGLVGNTGTGTDEHLHFELRFDQPNFTQGGIYSGAYDTQSQFDQGVNLGILFDPDEFVRTYSSTAALMKDFAPKGGVDVNLPKQGPRQILDFDDLFIFNTTNLIYDGFGYFGDIDQAIQGFDFDNLFAIHAPSYFDQGAGYVTGNTSGDWVAFNGGGLPGSITNDGGFDLDRASFTSAWNNDLELTITSYDLINGSYVERGNETIILDTDGEIDFVFGNDFKDVERIEFVSSGGTNDPDLNGFGTQFAMDDVFIFV